MIGGSYRLQFVLDPSRDGKTLQFKDLSLERVRREGGKETHGEILRTSINVSMGRPHIVGRGQGRGRAGRALPRLLPRVDAARGPGILLN